MSRLCLDTCAYSHFMRGYNNALEAIRSARRVFVPTIVLGELRTGFKLGSRTHENEAELRRFLDESVVEVLHVDDQVSEVYAQIIVGLRHEGTPIPTNDAWIAAIASCAGATVLTYDQHFRLIPNVGVQFLDRDHRNDC